MDPRARSPANRGGWGWTPDPRQIGGGTPTPDPRQIGGGGGGGDRGFRALPESLAESPVTEALQAPCTRQHPQLDELVRSGRSLSGRRSWPYMRVAVKGGLLFSLARFHHQGTRSRSRLSPPSPVLQNGRFDLPMTSRAMSPRITDSDEQSSAD
jgi:hypothetical protein